jgi:hypothetical protein
LFLAEKPAEFPIITGTDERAIPHGDDIPKRHRLVEGSASFEKNLFGDSDFSAGAKLNGQTVKIVLQKPEEKDGKPTQNPNANQDGLIRSRNIPKLVQYGKLGEHREHYKCDRPLPQAERV